MGTHRPHIPSVSPSLRLRRGLPRAVRAPIHSIFSSTFAIQLELGRRCALLSMAGDEPIMRLFLVHVMRWRQFDLLADTWSPIFTFLWYTRHVKAAPALETLALSRCNLYLAAQGNRFHPVPLRQPLPFFGGVFLPSLRSVSLIGVHIDWEQPSLRNLSELQLKFHAR